MLVAFRDQFIVDVEATPIAVFDAVVNALSSNAFSDSFLPFVGKDVEKFRRTLSPRAISKSRYFFQNRKKVQKRGKKSPV